MLRAAENGDVRELTRLLENNANIQERDNHGFSPLHEAAVYGHEDAVRLLLENNADTAARDNGGSSPLHWAAVNGHEGAVRLLLENNADIAASTNGGSSPLHWAAMNGHEGAVRLLLEKNADIAARDNDGSSPLHLAAMNGDEGVVRLLLENNADIAASTNDGDSPLHLAARSGHVVAVRLLLENNADTAARDNDGSTPLDVALRYGYGAVAALLRQAAAAASPPQQAPVGQAEAQRVGEELARERSRRIAAEELARARCVAAEEEQARERSRRVAAEEETRRVGEQLARERERCVVAEEEQARERSRRVAAEEETRRVGEQLARERERCVAAEEEQARERSRRVAAEEETRRVGEQLARERERCVVAEEELARTREQLEAVLQAQQRSIAVISIEELRGATDGFSDANKIGQGGFGSVFRTHQPLPSLPHSGPCAVKRLDASGTQGLREVHSEIRVLSVCWHEHLLPLVGFCLDEATPCLVYPLMAGNLESRVVDVPQGQQRFSWQERVRAIRDATRALVYLHTPLAARSAVLHRDIKPSNILLDALGNAKLADVGLAREAPELQGGVTHVTTQRLIGTPGFIDPLYIQSGRFSELTDGYAMGVSLLVCLGGRPAIPVVDRFGNALEGLAPAETFTDPTAEWPPDVAEQALEVVRGLIWGRLPSQRMVLSQALSLLEAMADAQRLRPGIRDDGEDAQRSCIICMSAPRSVRFDCGHALCCTVNGCAAAILQRGVCPNCRVRISTIADQGDHIALQHTFVAVN
ncbi:hypothetical protein AB1Y20_017186 [Prymnesium parvum]|uniref:Protein kinase domain-containing protein n=1 Tax=Prymnesium parvum TaxID=97485 RepID=A0AB34I8J6_PRYPA